MTGKFDLRQYLRLVMVASLAVVVGCSQGSGGRTTANKPVAEQPPELESEPQAEKKLEQKNRDVAEGGTKSTAISPSEQLVQVKTLAPEKVRVGEAYEYELHVTNTSDQATVSQVKVEHTLPDGFQIESSEPEAEQSEGSATWTLSQLSPGEMQKITVRGLSDKEGAANACLTVTYRPTVCLTTQFVKPDLEVAKQAPDRARLCDPIQLSYRVTNNGSGAAKNVQVTDELPEGLTTMEGEQEVTFTIDELAAGESQEFQVATLASRSGEFASRAVAKAEGIDETRSSQTTTTVDAAKLEASIDGPGVEYIGRMLTYTVQVKNSGQVPAENAMLRVEAPQGLRLRWKGQPRLSGGSQNANPSQSDQSSAQSPTPAGAQNQQAAAPRPADVPPDASDEQAAQNSPPANARQRPSAPGAEQQQASDALAWNLGTLRPGETAEARISFLGREAGEVDLRAVAWFDCGEREKEMLAEDTTQTNLIALPALAVAVADTPDPVKVGEEVRYVITVVNEGQADDQQIKVTATLPESLEHVDNSGVTKGSLEGNTVTFETVETLKPGEEAAWTVRAKAKSAENTRLSVNVTSESQDEATAEEPTRLFDESDAESSQQGATATPANQDEEPKEQ